MALRPQFSLIHSEFNDFLFASLGDEQNGRDLTVLSALTRLGLDPWEEAARLSDLPKSAAARALAAVIVTLPDGDWDVSDSSSIATRLVDRLPERRTTALSLPGKAKGTRRKIVSIAALTVVCAVLGAALLLAMMHQDADRAAGPGLGSVSSMPR